MGLAKFVPFLFLVLTSLANASFLDEVNKTLSSVTDAVNESISSGASNKKERGSALKDTPLQDIFMEAPWDSNLPGDVQWPRVAIVVHDEPAFHSDITPHLGGSFQEGCWELSAIIWRSENDSEKVENFMWCTPENVLYEVAKRDAGMWFIGTAQLNFEKNTGSRRTNGPNPPAKAYPSDMKHKRFFKRDFDIDVYNGEMFAALLYQMGLNWDDSWDRRVWITQFDHAVD